MGQSYRDMRELVAFISRYVPAYASVVRGEPDDKIARMEKAIKRPLPSVYRDFLSTAAANIGYATGDVDFRLDSVLGLTGFRRAMPERFIPVARDQSFVGSNYFLDLLHPAGDGDAMVVRVPEDLPMEEEQEPIFWSLRDLLFYTGFATVRMGLFQETTALHFTQLDEAKPPPEPSVVDEVLVRLGFEAQQVSGPNARLYERNDAAASLYRSPFESWFLLNLSARDERTMREVVEIVGDATAT